MSFSNYTAMDVTVTARTFCSPIQAGGGNAAQAWCPVASAATKNVAKGVIAAAAQVGRPPFELGHALADATDMLIKAGR